MKTREPGKIQSSINAFLQSLEDECVRSNSGKATDCISLNRVGIEDKEMAWHHSVTNECSACPELSADLISIEVARMYLKHLGYDLDTPEAAMTKN